MAARSLTKLSVFFCLLTFIVVMMFFSKFCLENLIRLSIGLLFIIILIGLAVKYGGLIKDKIDFNLQQERFLISIILFFTTLLLVIITAVTIEEQTCVSDDILSCKSFGGECRDSCYSYESEHILLNGKAGSCEKLEVCCM